MSERYPNYFYAGIALLFVLIGFVVNVSSIPLFDVDEGAFSEATREMLASNIWSATYLDGEPRYDKPILTYWIQAIMVKLFGLNELGLRLHSVCAAILWMLASAIFCRQYVNDKSAWFFVCIFSSTLWITLIGRAATADALLNLFIALSFFDIYRFTKQQQKKYALRAWLWMSLGVLTKGPVAAAIPVIASLIWLISLNRSSIWLAALKMPLGWMIFLSVITPWLFMVWQEQGSGFFYGFLVEHNLNRFATAKEGHGGAWYYYLIILPLIILPYSGLLIPLFGTIKLLWKRPFERLLLIWFFLVLFLVSIAQTKLPHYILYGVTPLIILFAKHRFLLASSNWQVLAPLAFCAIQITLVVIAPNLAAQQNNLYQQEMLANADQVFSKTYLYASVALTIAVLCIFLTHRPGWQKLLGCGILQTLFCYIFLLPSLADIQQTPIKQAALYSKNIQAPFVAYKMHMPSFSLYREAITARRAPALGDYVYTRADRMQSLQALFPTTELNIIYQSGGIRIVQIPHQEP
ncbi:ArnT family glycosyltransferase [Gayadomonas joobiniege]|uniref:ArnT family glycosyltransferase n=1 Tax=Gayadomonas joobiniege TaxID=1234606 RepID=UPI00035E8B2F|nr:glycosyltransferase family 39 protein [Gayadomonas joobiniege]